MDLKQITYAELKKLRLSQFKKQNGICPILKREIDYKDAVFDHCHKTKAEVLGEDGKGLLRGVIHNLANVMEGKVSRTYRRYGLHKLVPLPSLLRNLANYLERPPMELKYVHPNERVFEKIGKREFNKICKHYFEIYPKRKKLPKYPKSGKVTKELKKSLEKVKKL